MRRPETHRILAIDPTSRGFGFVVIEGPTRLVDWGVKSLRRNKDEATLLAVADLFQLYRPVVLVVEDCADPRSRRRKRARGILRDVRALAATRGVTSRIISIPQVRAVFAKAGAKTKHEIAGVIAARFPELARHRPRRRKPWMSEDERMAMFDAAALAMTLIRAVGREAHPQPQTSG